MGMRRWMDGRVWVESLFEGDLGYRGKKGDKKNRLWGVGKWK